MTAINQILDEAKIKSGIKADNALAIEIGISRQGLSGARKGRTSFDPYTRQRLADLTGRKIEEINARIEMETETDEKKREYWKNFYQTIGGIAASFSIVALIAPIYVAFEGLHCILC